MILRRVARPLLASVFISSGIQELRQKETHAEVMKPLLDKTVGPRADRIPQQVPTDPVTFVQIDGAIKTAAGAMLALGIFPRVASVLLLGTLVPSTAAGHPFWEEKDPQQRQQHTIHFLKNAGLAGGLLLAAADTAGKPSVGWRARRAASGVGHQVQGTAGSVQHSVGRAAGKAEHLAGRARGVTSGKAGKAAGKTGMLGGLTSGAATGKAGEFRGRASKAAGKAKGAVSGKAGELGGKAGKLAGKTGAMSGLAGVAGGKGKGKGKRGRRTLAMSR